MAEATTSGAGEILALKRWSDPIVYNAVDGHPITFEVARLKFHEKGGLERAVALLRHRLVTAKDRPALEQIEIAADMLGEIPAEKLRHWFGYVRNVEGITVDGKPVDGPGLFDEADQHLVMFVLMTLERLARLTPPEGKGFGSRSTSSSAEQAPESSSSGATPTEDAVGTEPSTATETLPEEQSSLQPVEA